MRSCALCMACAVAFALWPLHAAPAASINHGDFDDIGNGGTVAYENVTESTNQAVTLPVYGAPTVVGNTINFDPVGFGLTSGPAGPSGGFLDVALQFDIRAEGPATIDSFFIQESGDYTLSNLFGVISINTFVEVSAPWNVVILETTLGPLANPVIVQGNLVFSPISAVPTSPQSRWTLSGDPGTGVSWNGQQTIDITAELLLAGISDQATLVDFSMDNILIVANQDGTIASIAKKDTTGVTMTVNGPPAVIVPEPSTLALTSLLTLLAAMGIWWRRS